jgi:hypothetical protein
LKLAASLQKDSYTVLLFHENNRLSFNAWDNGMNLTVRKKLVCTAQRTSFVSVTKPNLLDLLLLGGVIALRSEKHMKQMNTICEQSAELFIAMRLEICSCQWALSCKLDSLF